MYVYIDPYIMFRVTTSNWWVISSDGDSLYCKAAHLGEAHAYMSNPGMSRYLTQNTSTEEDKLHTEHG